MTDTKREFMTSWHSSTRPPIEAWSMRDRSTFAPRGTSTKHVPPFRAFDLLAQPNDARVLLENADHRIGVESVCGARAAFRRHVDFDTVYFQYAGTTVLETEFGEFTMVPGDLMFIPEGIAHRSSGTADSLRWFAHVVTPFIQFMDDDAQTSETRFTVTRRNGPNWTLPPGGDQPVRGGRVTEEMICWHDAPSDRTVVERDYAALAGVSSTAFRDKVSGIRKLRAFDTFRDIAGTSGEPPAIFRAPNLEIKTYNIIGEQFAFHRALRSEEVRIQFRGQALDLSELQDVPCRPGLVTIVPRGIAHSVITEPPDSPDFLRLNFYSHLPWSYPTDLTKHAFDSTFEIETTIVREAAWKQQPVGA